MDRNEYIQSLARQNDNISMTNGNSKLGRACLSLAMPVVTCRTDAPCKSTCYACKGCQQFAKVQAAYYRNLRLYSENPNDFFEQVHNKITSSKLPKVRIFDSGDFPNYDFLVRLVNLCNQTPEVKYMAFTKKYELVNEYISNNGGLPDNLNIIFSAWSKDWNIQNPYELAVAYIDFDDKALNPAFPKHTFKCPGRKSTCSECGACWNKKLKAVVFEQH